MGRWFPLIAAFAVLVLAAGVVFIMILFGWRFTFAPELSNNWDAISAVAAWVGVFVAAIGVVASFVAIWYAIQVPKEIADRQNKIALFEKRLSCFEMLTMQRALYFSIKDETDTEKIKHGVVSLYCADSLRDFNEINFSTLVDKLINQCIQMSFLFDGIEYEEASELGIAFGKLITALYSADNERVMVAKRVYIKKISDFIGSHIEEFSKYLFISKP